VRHTAIAPNGVRFSSMEPAGTRDSTSSTLARMKRRSTVPQPASGGSFIRFIGNPEPLLDSCEHNTPFLAGREWWICDRHLQHIPVQLNRVNQRFSHRLIGVLHDRRVEGESRP
jgi:hypothetical protein